MRLMITLCHLQQKTETHPLLLLLIRLPHNVIGTPDVVSQIICYSLAQVWLGPRIGKWDGLAWAHKGCIKRPACQCILPETNLGLCDSVSLSSKAIKSVDQKHHTTLLNLLCCAMNAAVSNGCAQYTATLITLDCNDDLTEEGLVLHNKLVQSRQCRRHVKHVDSRNNTGRRRGKPDLMLSCSQSPLPTPLTLMPSSLTACMD